jgi:(heptosyl)LPS beta-1,4-glucosyltransferase
MPGQLPVSVLLITRNEAARLERRLPEWGFAAEIVVVDDHSSDATGAVAARHGAVVIERALEGFGPQRAFALARCTQPWVLWLDADERLDATALAALEHVVTADPEARGTTAGYAWLRHTWFLGRRIRHCGWRGERVTRLFRRTIARFDDAVVHERVHLDGPVRLLPGILEHHSYDTWEDCREKLVRYAHAGAEARRREGRGAGPLDVALRPPLRFVQTFVLQAGFLDGAHGLAVCVLAAMHVALRELELWAGRRAR